MNIGIVLDSTLDVTDELRDKVYWVPLKVDLAGQVFQDGTKTIDEIFRIMREKNTFAKTSQPSPIEFEKVYEKLLQEHEFVISIHISEKLSGTVESARMAAEKFKERVFVFDTGAATIVAQKYVEKVLQMKDERPEKILKELERLRAGMHLFLTVGSLEFLKRSGRLKGMEAMIGSLLRLRPVIEVVGGALKTRKIIRGDARLLSYMKRLLQEFKGDVLVGNIHAPEKSQQLYKEAKKLGRNVLEVPVRSCALSVHLGPGSYGIAIFENV